MLFGVAEHVTKNGINSFTRKPKARETLKLQISLHLGSANFYIYYLILIDYS